MNTFEQILIKKLLQNESKQSNFTSEKTDSMNFNTDTLIGLFNLNIKNEFETQRKINSKLFYKKQSPPRKPQPTPRQLSSNQTKALELLTSLGALLYLDFSERDLTREYKRLLRKWHPDFNRSPDASQNVQLILKSKAILISLFKTQK